MEISKINLKQIVIDLLTAIIAGSIVSFAYYFFQNSNGFAPGGVGGLATITYYLLNYNVAWAYIMLAFNIPIFILVAIFVNRKLGVYLIVYMLVQSLGTELLKLTGLKPYSAEFYGGDFEIMFACIATGVISGFGFSVMLKRFGASGGTYAISALIKKKYPATNVAQIAFIMDSSVVAVAFFVYGMKITPVLCTLLNLFVANVVVDNMLAGLKNGYKFEIITDKPDELANEIIQTLHHGVTEINVTGMYSHESKYMIVCIIRKKEIGTMMKIIKKYEGSFASFSKANEVFGRFHK